MQPSALYLHRSHHYTKYCPHDVIELQRFLILAIKLNEYLMQPYSVTIPGHCYIALQSFQVILYYQSFLV